MSIKPPNHTQTPNVLFDKWLPYLREAELKVLLVIIRKTFGYHKKKDRISISQLTKLTGLSEPRVILATNMLIEKKLISKTVVGAIGKQKSFYEIVFDSPEEIERKPIESDKRKIKIIFTPSDSEDPKIPKETPSDSEDTKENKTKERKEEKEIYKEKFSFGEFKNVKLSKDEHQKLLERLGADKMNEMIKRLDLYAEQKGIKYKSHYAAILSWVNNDENKRKESESSTVGNHRKGSKLAFEKEKDTWKPNSIKV